MPESETLFHLRARLSRLLPVKPEPDTDLLSFTLPAPPGLAHPAFPGAVRPSFVWHHPGSGCQTIGLGIAWQTQSSGSARWHVLSAALAGLKGRWRHIDPDGCGTAPAAFAAVAFDEHCAMDGEWSAFPNSLLAVPALTLRRVGDAATLTFTCRAQLARDDVLAHWRGLLEQLFSGIEIARASPGGTPAQVVAAWPEHADWWNLVAAATAAIRRGELKKVVAVRRVTMQSAQPHDPARIAARLAGLYPECRILSVALGESRLIAATPERLIALKDGQVTCDALGGSTGRGDSDPEDLQLGRALLASPKARQEHALVVEDELAALAPLCESVTAPAVPSVARFRNIQHLWTEVRGRARPGVTLLDLAQRLHPTPAVGGLPREAARAWLARHNPLARGWYTGAAGWLNTDGEGEMAVLLRCALLQGGRAHLYAGAGLVADSDPQAEYAETGLKLMPMLEALAVEETPLPEMPACLAACR